LRPQFYRRHYSRSPSHFPLLLFSPFLNFQVSFCSTRGSYFCYFVRLRLGGEPVLGDDRFAELFLDHMVFRSLCGALPALFYLYFSTPSCRELRTRPFISPSMPAMVISCLSNLIYTCHFRFASLHAELMASLFIPVMNAFA